MIKVKKYTYGSNDMGNIESKKEVYFLGLKIYSFVLYK